MRWNGVLLGMAAIVAMTLSSACGDDECHDAADATVDALVPEDQEVHCEDSEEFEVDGRTVSFTHVEYGALRDCPSGCFSSHVCAIEDGDGVELYSSFWNDESEKPVGIDAACPNRAGANTRDCETSGKSHPLTETEAFQSLAAMEGSGPFRWCFN